MSAQFILLLASVIVILVHCVCVAARMSGRRWGGRRARFAGIAASIAVMAGGAFGMLLGAAYAPLMLAAGVAGSFVFDRRGSC